jgi:NADH dehydrogenase
MRGCITVFGGTGFIGRHLVTELLRSGATVRVAARHPGDVQITTQSAHAPEINQADLLDQVTVDGAIAGASMRQVASMAHPPGIRLSATAIVSR